MYLAHFLNADEKFRTDLEGMSPDEDKHDYVLRFQPVILHL